MERTYKENALMSKHVTKLPLAIVRIFGTIVRLVADSRNAMATYRRTGSVKATKEAILG